MFPVINRFKYSREMKEWSWSYFIDDKTEEVYDFPDPFTARLAGMKRVIEILEERKKQKSSVVKNTNDEFEEE